MDSISADAGHDVPAVQRGGLHVPDKTWYKDSGLRSLYKWMPILMLGSNYLSFHPKPA